MPLRFPTGEIRLPLPLKFSVPDALLATGSCTTLPEVEKLSPAMASVLPPAPTLTEALVLRIPAAVSALFRSVT